MAPTKIFKIRYQMSRLMTNLQSYVFRSKCKNSYSTPDIFGPVLEVGVMTPYPNASCSVFLGKGPTLIVSLDKLSTKVHQNYLYSTVRHLDSTFTLL